MQPPFSSKTLRATAQLGFIIIGPKKKFFSGFCHASVETCDTKSCFCKFRFSTSTDNVDDSGASLKMTGEQFQQKKWLRPNLWSRNHFSAEKNIAHRCPGKSASSQSIILAKKHDIFSTCCCFFVRFIDSVVFPFANTLADEKILPTAHFFHYLATDF